MTLATPIEAAAQASSVLISTRGDRTLAGLFGGQHLVLDLHGKAHRGLWAIQLDELLSRRDEPVMVVAQGVSCLAVAWWAQLSPRSYLDHIVGAVFMAPLNFNLSEASVARSLRPSPGTRLPFPSIVLSGATPIIGQVLELADNWGSRFVDAGAPHEARERASRTDPSPADDRLLEIVARLAGEEKRSASLWRADVAEDASRDALLANV